MDLVAVRVRGWRKFRRQTTLQTNGKLISILGPNEAGKSSLLEALHFLDSDQPAEHGDIARGSSRDDLLVEAFFSLSNVDKEAAGLRTDHRVIWSRTADETGLIRLDPVVPLRDLGPRKSAARNLDRALKNEKFMSRLDDEQIDALSALNPVLASQSQDLSSDQLAAIRAAYSNTHSVDTDGLPLYVKSLSSSLETLFERESDHNPQRRAHEAIWERIPDFLLFSQPDRDLRQEYSFEDLSSDIPIALSNLADVAGLDIGSLISAVGDGDTARVETMRARANRRLRQRFQETWSQSGVRASFVLKDRTLQVLIENDNDEFTALAERSDGFRQFVALQSFVLKERKRDPILLIDEAETHLHYDAQADLVQMLARQTVARKVIYTTHSAGALPEDLGNGVRLVTSCADDDHSSRVVNRFWGGEQTGFSPLLIGMGASTLAFFPTRRALLVEGETEMLLLPTLFREVGERDILGFQVVPGLAKAAKGLLPVSNGNQSHVCYLVDGDSAGKAIATELRRAGADNDSIFRWEDKDGTGLEFEDVMRDDILIDATANLIARFTPGVQFNRPRKLPKTKKVSAVTKAYAQSTGKELSKIDLAYGVLNIVGEDSTRRIVDPSTKQLVMNLLKRVEVRLSLDSVDLSRPKRERTAA